MRAKSKLFSPADAELSKSIVTLKLPLIDDVAAWKRDP